MSNYFIEAEIKVAVKKRQLAELLLHVLRPEIEVDMSGARGELRIEGNYLVARIKASSYSGLRASINAFIRLLNMVLNLIGKLSSYE